MEKTLEEKVEAGRALIERSIRREEFEFPKVIISDKETRTVMCAALYDSLKTFMNTIGQEFTVLDGEDFPEDLPRMTAFTGRKTTNSMCVISKVENLFEISELFPFIYGDALIEKAKKAL